MIRLIVGLGNPGQEYASTRHNVGAWFIDKIAIKYDAVLANESKFFAITGKFRYKNYDIHLLKPQTYMNISGKSVLAIANFYKILPAEILIVHDELDFIPGIVKLKHGGGNGGHNGLKDVDRVLGKDYWRLRIGIGHPGDKSKVASYVLNSPDIDDSIEIAKALDKSIKVLEALLSGEMNIAMKQLHTN